MLQRSYFLSLKIVTFLYNLAIQMLSLEIHEDINPFVYFQHLVCGSLQYVHCVFLEQPRDLGDTSQL